MPQGPPPILSRIVRRVARWSTLYLTQDRFELHKPTHTSEPSVAPDVRRIVELGIEISFNRIPMYAGLARMLAGVDLGDVAEFGGSNPALSRLLTYRSWNVAPNYPEVDVTNLHQYQAGSVDTIVLDNILEHVLDPETAVRECARVLRPGGRLIAAVPFLVPIHAAPADYTRWTPEGFRQLLGKSLAHVAAESWGNTEALELLIQSGAPHGWPTFALGCARWGMAPAIRVLSMNDPNWPITIWAIGTKASAKEIHC